MQDCRNEVAVLNVITLGSCQEVFNQDRENASATHENTTTTTARQTDSVRAEAAKIKTLKIMYMYMPLCFRSIHKTTRHGTALGARFLVNSSLAKEEGSADPTFFGRSEGWLKKQRSPS